VSTTLEAAALPAARAVKASPIHSRSSDMRPFTASARLIGALFIAGFLFYGIGFGIVSSVTTGPGFATAIPAHEAALAIGAFLMLLNTVVDIGKGVLFFPIAARYGRRTALAYLAFIIVEVVLLDIGVLGLFMLIPLGQQAVDPTIGGVLGSLLIAWNAIAYQVAEMTLALGALPLCLLLFRVRLIPRSLAAWGAIGYAILMTGAVAELLGIRISLVLSIPGGLFEVALGVWLLTKGFAANAQEPRSTASVAASVEPALAPA
jgi:hypothetical protein